MTPLRVVCGVWIRDGRVFAARRGPTLRHAGRWELPGGKVEPGEDDRAALRRELREELGVDLRVDHLVGEAIGPRLHLLAFACCGDDTPRLDEHDASAWLSVDELDALDWTEPDTALLPDVRAALSASTAR